MTRFHDVTRRARADCCHWKLSVLLAGSLAGAIASASSAEKSFTNPAGVIQLFNGTNLTGWYSWLVDTRHEDPRGVFGVTNEMIRISGNGLGYLATTREFHDYHLIVEFMWGRSNWTWGNRIGKARDSGIFLHGIGSDGNSHDGNGAFRAAIECQVMQCSVGDLLLIRGRAGDGSLIAPLKARSGNGHASSVFAQVIRFP